MVTKINIKEQREKLGLLQKDVANYVGVSIATVSRWESGYIASLKDEIIPKLAQILQVSPIAILNSEDRNDDIEDHLPSTLRLLEKEWNSISDNDKAIIEIIAEKYKKKG